MRDRFWGQLAQAAPAALPHPDVLDETVVHDPSGRPWLVCTVDVRDGCGDLDATFGVEIADPAGRRGRYETQVYYTARAGICGLPTGYGERHLERTEAIAGHRRWCRRVRAGEVTPDRVPDDPF
jgi:hypothetical protein